MNCDKCGHEMRHFTREKKWSCTFCSRVIYETEKKTVDRTDKLLKDISELVK